MNDSYRPQKKYSLETERDVVTEKSDEGMKDESPFEDKQLIPIQEPAPIRGQAINQQLEWLEVGTITSPQGLKGELRVYPDSDFPERFTQTGKRWLQHPDTSRITEVQLQSGRHLSGKNLYVIKLEGIEDRSQAEELRNYKLLVNKSDRPKLSKDEYHVADLVGLEVYHQETGENIGVVVDLYSAGNDLLEIKLHQQPETKAKSERDLSQVSRRSKRKKYKPKPNKPLTIFVPFVKEIVPVVDISNQRLEISPPDGLINIHETG